MVNGLQTVTITGADDAVNQVRLFELAQEFPFVEWAILRSTSRGGTKRYPGDRWLDGLARLALRDDSAKFAAHLCGELCEATLAGSPRTIENEAGLFRRFQLNGWSKFKLPGLRVAKLFPDIEFIAQATSLEAFDHTMWFIKQFGITNLNPLFDPSGGRGLSLNLSQLPPTCAYSMGYAGGITPDNVERILERLSAYGLPFWIDMESGVRTNDAFDLDKVYRVLCNCRAFAIRDGGA
jgi:hypothetical protein